MVLFTSVNLCAKSREKLVVVVWESKQIHMEQAICLTGLASQTYTCTLHSCSPRPCILPESKVICHAQGIQVMHRQMLCAVQRSALHSTYYRVYADMALPVLVSEIGEASPTALSFSTHPPKVREIGSRSSRHQGTCLVLA